MIPSFAIMEAWDDGLQIYAGKKDILQVHLLDQTILTIRVLKVDRGLVHAELLDRRQLHPVGFTHFPLAALFRVTMRHSDNTVRRTLNKIFESEQ